MGILLPVAAVDGEHRTLTPLTDCLYKIVYSAIRRISKMLILKEFMAEARVGIEPANKGFADLCAIWAKCASRKLLSFSSGVL
jgi:hypothetical protein